MKKNLSLVLLFSLSGCISLTPQEAPLKEAVFRAPLQQVWLSAEKALTNYPIAESNIDSGLLKTDYQRGPNCWTAPGVSEKYSSGIRCNMLFQFVFLQGTGTRVRITKTIEMVRDFVAEPEKIESDGLEEMSILYRIDRELTINKEISQNSKKSK
ncbi:MAG: hypothetical protein RJB66_1147 [Pseudomonadota bacterium]|jgi:hypothetical protein